MAWAAWSSSGLQGVQHSAAWLMKNRTSTAPLRGPKPGRATTYSAGHGGASMPQSLGVVVWRISTRSHKQAIKRSMEPAKEVMLHNSVLGWLWWSQNAAA
ncbi:unnamed protein product [Prunus armeniaca]|uniref:Uncharacterized protein n=1 Tax=Prunus armeniaca TaxID=36596 RepID=A0A6J5TJT5_PRUAR|nr:unnamed protein product [Prunus armeniaca]